MRLTLLAILAAACAAAVSAQAAEDRYGPARPHPMQLASSGYQGRMLTWSSRAFTPQTPEPSPAAALAPQPAPAPTMRREPAPAPRIVAAAATPSSARASAPGQAALPQSLYSPPPATAPQKLAQASPPPATPASEGSHVRLYSVHRQYGLTPDAIPEPPANASNYVLIGVPNDSGKSASADRDGDADADDKPF